MWKVKKKIEEKKEANQVTDNAATTSCIDASEVHITQRNEARREKEAQYLQGKVNSHRSEEAKKEELEQESTITSN